MRMTKRGRMFFTQLELNWLAEQALRNELAADILVRYNRRYDSMTTRLPGWLTELRLPARR